MTITTIDHVVDSMGNNSSRIIIDKASIANTSVGNFFSLWRATGQPGQGAIPTTAAVCTNSLVGSLQFTQQTSPATSYLGLLECIAPNASVTIEIHDRLMHMGGLDGATLTAQAVDVDIDLNLGTSNLGARIGDANYSDIQWWLEWYVDTGATASNATVNVRLNDGTDVNLTAVAVGATVRASRMIPLNSLIPAANSGKYIMRVNTVQLSGNITTADSFGVTATRYRGALFMPIANARFTRTWSELGLPEIPNSSCLFPIVIANATSTGNIKGTGKIMHG
jgi:hypothetical protein